MESPLLSSSNLERLSQPSAAENAPLVVVSWAKFGTHRLHVHTAGGQLVGWVDLKTGHRSLAMPELGPAFQIAVSEAEDAPRDTTDSPRTRQALTQAIELALIAGQDARPADATPAPMRHAYRGTCAYSSWELGPRGTRLMAEDRDHLAPLDPRWAYLNSTLGDHDADIAQLFEGQCDVSPSKSRITTGASSR